MCCVFTTLIAELFELQALRRLLFVFGRNVITRFALSALQNDIVSRHIFEPSKCGREERYPCRKISTKQ